MEAYHLTNLMLAQGEEEITNIKFLTANLPTYLKQLVQYRCCTSCSAFVSLPNGYISTGRLSLES